MCVNEATDTEVTSPGLSSKVEAGLVTDHAWAPLGVLVTCFASLLPTWRAPDPAPEVMGFLSPQKASWGSWSIATLQRDSRLESLKLWNPWLPAAPM